jgi:hypothetical protein
MAQQVSTLLTIKQVKQLKDPSFSLKSKKGLKNYYVSEYLKEISLLSKDEFNSDYSIKNFQKSCSQRNNNFARFNRIEEGLKEIQNNVNQLADLFQKKHTYENIKFVRKQVMVKKVV